MNPNRRELLKSLLAFPFVGIAAAPVVSAPVWNTAGTASDVWGMSLTVEDINCSNFGIRIPAGAVVDRVTITRDSVSVIYGYKVAKA